MKLIYGTGNPGKFSMMKEALKELDVELLSLRDLPAVQEEPEETGRTPLENARQKAEFYYSIFKMPVFSCDSGMYIEGLPEEEQPGVHVRNVGGRRLSDATDGACGGSDVYPGGQRPPGIPGALRSV